MHQQNNMIPHHLFEKVVDSFPDNVAVEESARKVTYRTLNRNADQLANILREVGVKSDSIVVVLSPLSVESITSMLSIFKAGGIYFPIDMGFSEKRMRQVFTQTFDGVLVVRHDQYNLALELLTRLSISFTYLIVISDSAIKVVDAKSTSVREINFDEEAYSAENHNHGVTAEDSNYIFYTSGSTGEGKAILGCNKSLYHYVNWVNNEFDIKAHYRIAHLSQVTFDASLKDTFMALGTGATLCIPSGSTKNNLGKLVEWIDATGVNIFQTVPSVFRLIIKELSSLTASSHRFKELKHIMLDGEVLFSKDVTNWRSLVGNNAELVNLYGTTESTILDTFHRIKDIPENPSAALHVGKPIDKKFILIISENRLCPIGKIGEVYIKTPFLTKGYYKNEALTEASFVQNPLVTNKKDIVYKTGDLGCYLKDRSIEILGRKDQQVKINGIRIELNEIEQAVLEIEGIEQVVVKAYQQNEHHDLVCYFTSDKVEAGTLRESLKTVLNKNVIPAYFVKLENFPLNINGKIDKKALPLPEEITQSAVYEAPVNEVESTLEKIWREVLGLNRISRRISFFAIGGQSLRAVQLISRIHKQFEIDLSLPDIFKNETIELQANLISAATKRNYAAILKVEDQPWYEVTHAQKRLWLLSQTKEQSVAYNVPYAFHLVGALEISALEKSLKTVLDRHEILRTTFIEIDGNPKQRVSNNMEINLEFTDLRDQSAVDEKVSAIVNETVSHAFDLEKGPLWRVKLLQTAPNEYVFILVIHHSIIDAWSSVLLINEIKTLYNAYKAGGENPLLPLKIQYRDYTAWLNKQLTHESLIPHENYWLNKFNERTPLLELPTDFQRNIARTDMVGKAMKVMDVALNNGLDTLSRDLGCSKFMTLLAVVKTLLYRYTGQEDIVIGSPVTGRVHADLEDQIGFYVNTLALRSKIDGNKSFAEFLQSIKEATLEAYDHQVYPFDQLVDALERKGYLKNVSLFNVLMTLQHSSIEKQHESLDGVDITNYTDIEQISKFDLIFGFKEIPNGLCIDIEYNANLFADTRIRRMITHFECMLESLVNDANQPLDKVLYLAKEEVNNVLYNFNNTSSSLPYESTIPKLFQAQVAKTPNAIAVVFEGNRLTYRELNERSNRLAHYLREKYNIKKDDFVGLMAHRSELMVIGLLGILKSGGAYVPVDPDYPASRIGYMLENSAVKVVLTENRLLADIENASTFSLDDEDTLISYPKSDPVHQSEGTDLAYLMYTSGSTGQPKGVMVEHRNVIRLVKSTDYVPLKEGTRLLQTGSLSFDATTFEIWGMLLNGGELHLIAQENLLDIQYLSAKIKASSIEMMWFTASWFNKLVDSDINLFENLKWLLVGGEKLSTTHVNKVLQTYPGIQLINGYGPTENTTFSVCHLINKEYAFDVPLGKPISNSTAYVLDKYFQPVGVGVTGEIYLGGEGVARGYWESSKLTEEKFINDPFQAGKRLYRSGDLGRWNENGVLQYIGRNDAQVKIRGYRIEPDEVAHAMLKVKGLRNALVTVTTTERNEKALIAYYTSDETVEPSIIRAYVSEHLPAYMMPVYFIALEEFPLTANGKIDYKALPAAEESDLGLNYFPPTNLLEEQLAKIWCKVLGKEKIGIQDNFFESGGQSLMAMQVVSRIHKELNCKLGLKDLFIHSTVQALAALLMEKDQTSYKEIEAIAECDYYETSHAQKRLWLLSQLSASRCAYNMPSAYVLKGRLDKVALEESFKSLVARHESLRTTFIAQEGSPKQKIHSPEEYLFKVLHTDLRRQEDRVSHIKRISEEEAGTVFDLESGPLLRAMLVQEEDDSYILFLTIHHIVSDGWSMEVLIRELLLVYNAYQRGEKNSLSPLRIQYKDYASWLNSQLSNEQLKIHQQYWQSQFEGTIPVLELLADRPRPLVKTYNGDRQVFSLGESLCFGLKEVGRKKGASLFMTLVACVKALLYRYTGQEDIIVGTAIAGREHLNLENQIGFYANTLALRSKFSGSSAFNKLLDVVKRVSLDGYEHQTYPFDKLVEELNLIRDTSRSPLFDVMVGLQKKEMDEKDTEINGIEVRGYVQEIKTSKFDFIFNFQEVGNDIVGSLEYNSDIYNRDRIERMVNHFHGIVRSVIENAETPLNKLDYLAEVEKKKLLEDFNATTRWYPFENTIQELFEEQVRANPEAIAIVFDGKYLSYQTLNERSNKLAHYLRDKYDVRKDDLIGIISDRSLEMIVGILGILKSGAAYVPIDPEYPIERIEYVIKDSGLQILIADAERNLKTTGVDSLVLNREKIFEKYPCTNPVVINNARSLAYLMYTSGSTGFPKGVMVEQRSVVRLVKETNYTAINSNDRLIQLSNYAFDGSVFDIFGSLLNGATLYSISQETLLNNDLLGDFIERERITQMFITTALFNNLVVSKGSRLKGLDKIYFGGEEASLWHIREALKYVKENTLVHVYGPTEGTTFSTYYEISSLSDESLAVPIGGPICNTTVYILDNHHELVPIGVGGDIYLGGAGLARGYWRKEEQTSERFITSPFGSADCLYKTGDIGRWTSSGVIEFLGRSDNQVKVRGHRIEMGEIENVLVNHSEVGQAFVTTKTDVLGGKELVAYYTGPALESPLRSYMAGKVPGYMIPSYFVKIESFPLTKNGKIDQALLPDPQGELEKRSYKGAGNEREEKLCCIWQEVLGLERIGVDDNFFEIGGHSIKAMQVISRIHRELNCKLELKNIFTHPTIENLSRLIEQAQKQKYEEIVSASEQEYYDVSHAQKRLWVLSQFEEGRLAYNMPGAYILEGKLDRSAFEQSFKSLVSRHESLRTTFITIDGQPKQKIHSADAFPFCVAYDDLRNEPEKESKASAISEETSSVIFDLEKGPLLHVKLLQLEDEKNLVLLTMHHIISDGWSMQILVRDLLKIYNAYCKGMQNPLTPLRIHYKDYASWQSTQLTGKLLHGDRQYWLERFSGELPVLDLPTDYPRPSVKTYHGNSIVSVLDEITNHSLNELSKKNGASLFITILACVKTLLYRYTNQNDIIIGTPVAGREHLNLEDQIGFYINTVALRTQFSGASSFSSLLEQVKANVLNGFSHQLYPFDKLVDELSLQHDTSRSPLFDVMVVLQNAELEGTDITPEGLQASGYKQQVKTSKFDLTFIFKTIGKELVLVLEYNTDIYSTKRIERLIEHFKGIVSSILVHTSIPLNELNYIDSKEEQLLLEVFNDTVIPYSKDKTIQELFEIQARKTPQRIAIVYDNNTLTYQQLNEKSNQLAHYLRVNYHVKRDELVGLMMYRSELMVIALLGILKSGGAYVPIDPDYPEERVQYLLRDSEIKLVITEKDLSVPVEGISCLSLEDDTDILAACSSEDPVHVNRSRDLAYLMYTSGSTGTPKGVMIEHQSVVRLVKSTNYVSIQEGTRLLQTGALSFDATTFEIWGMLLNGGELHLMSHEDLLNLSTLKNKMYTAEIEMMWFTSSWFNQLVDSDISLFGKLKYLLVGGEKLSPQHINKVREAYPSLRIVNGYGPTENTTFSVCHPIDFQYEESIPIGRPISNSSAYILDPRMRTVPVGIPGELYLGGDGLARGYWNSNTLTLEKFVKNPFKEGRLYKTGDRAVWDSIGTIQFLGRKDSQIKLRGYRIELGEIESALKAYEFVKEAIVLIRGEDPMKELVGYYTTEVLVEETGMRNYLENRLPAYMIPNFLIRLEHFPLTANGKIDYRSLPKIEELELSNSYVEPRDKEEDKLASVWQEVLLREKIGVYDNFFSVGGDSIKAIRLVSAINKALQCHVAVKDIYSHQDISSLAAYIKTQSVDLNTAERKKAAEEIKNIKESILGNKVTSSLLPGDIEDLYSMSDIQKGMVFHNILDSGAGIYIDQVYYYIEDTSFNFKLFQRALELLSEKHEMLRTSFNLNDFREAIQIVHRSLPVEDHAFYEDIVSLSEGNQQNYIEQYLKVHQSQGFELHIPGLWRICVFRLTENEYGIVLIFHHALMDGWSNASLMTEFSNVYINLKKNKAYRPDLLRATYKDYIIDQLISKRSTDTQTYWKTQMQGYERTSLPLSKTFSHAAITLKEFDKQGTMLDVELAKSIQQLSERMKVSNKDIYLAAFIYLIKATTNTNDITIGLVSNGRPGIEDGDKIIGCFLNTVPFRIKLSNRLTVHSLIKDVNETSIALKKNDLLSLKEIVSVTGLGSASMNALFDMIFNYNDFHITTEASEEVKVKTGNIKESTNANTYFDFNIEKIGDSIAVSINYLIGFYSNGEVQRILNYYINILYCFTNDLQGTITTDKVLSAGEKQEVLKTFNATVASYPYEKTIHQLFEDQVTKTPHAVALIQGLESLTYQQLNDKANQLAHCLRAKFDIRKGEIIGLLIDRSPWTVISILAVLKSGAAYLPIDTTTPKIRLEYLLEDGGVNILIAEDVTTVAEEIAGRYSILYLKEERADIEKYSKKEPGLSYASSDLAYLLYTSGSTGKPKGVEVMHRSVVNFLTSMAKAPGICEKDVCLAVSNYTFDISVLEMFLPLTHGAQVVLIAREELLDMMKLKLTIETSRPTIMQATPTLWSLLVESGWSGNKELKILCGGEKLNPELGKKLVALGGSLWNMYGPTETTIWSTVKQVRDAADLVSIGKPIDNTQLYIFDEAQSLVPTGVFGNLYIGGDGLAKGYRNQHGLKGEKFVRNPYGNERIYDTGDIARWLESGEIEYLNRKDNQVKIRGHRIELGEIENALLSYAGVENAAVIAKDLQLVAFFISKTELSNDALRDFLSQQLPSIMVPSSYVRVENFPLTTSGKIDRNALLALQPKLSENTLEYIAPRNALEAQLVSIWENVLDKEKIGIKDNFFTLGGHSIMAMHLVGRIHKDLNWELELKDLFADPTIAGLAALIGKTEHHLYKEIHPIEKQDYYEVSHGQKRLWVLDQYIQSRNAYNMPSAYLLEGDFVPEAFEGAFQALVQRHEILRTVFVKIDGEIKQKINSFEESGFKLKYMDLRTEVSKKQIAQEVVSRSAEHIFNLEKGPLLEAALLQLDEKLFLFHLNMHHIISDGWSIGVLVKEILMLYDAYRDGKENTLPELRLQYRDYTYWLNKQLEAQGANNHKSYWLNQFSNDIPVMELPMDYPRPTIKTFQGKSMQTYIDEKLTLQLKDLNRTEGASLFMILVAFVKVLLNRYSGYEDIIVGSPIAGRPHPDLENQIGFYVNTLALRTQFSSKQNFIEILQNVKASTLEAYEHQIYPFDRLVEDLNIETDLSRAPLFDIMVILQNTQLKPLAESSLKDVSVKTYDLNLNSSKYDLLFNFIELGNQLSMTIEYSTDLFDDQTIKKMEENFIHLIKTVMSDYRLPIAAVELLSTQEEEKELQDFLPTISTSSKYFAQH